VSLFTVFAIGCFVVGSLTIEKNASNQQDYHAGINEDDLQSKTTTLQRALEPQALKKPAESLDSIILERQCRNIPKNEEAFSAFLTEAYVNGESNAFIEGVSDQYDLCIGVPQGNEHYVKALLSYAIDGHDGALKELWKISDTEHLQSLNTPEIARDELLKHRAAFYSTKLELTEMAALEGSEVATLILVKALQQNVHGINKPNYVKALAYSYWGEQISRDNQKYLAFSWYKNKLESGSTPEEIQRARALLASFTIQQWDD